jgi:hypothetical protein
MHDNSQILKVIALLFQEPPIKFKPRKAVKLDEAISKTLKRCQVKVPVINVRQNIFMVGPIKVNVEERTGKLLARPVG